MKIKITKISPVNIDVSTKDSGGFGDYLLKDIVICFCVYTDHEELEGKVSVPGSLLTPIIESSVEKIREQIKNIK
jgi:hypothetical protein